MIAGATQTEAEYRLATLRALREDAVRFLRAEFPAVGEIIDAVRDLPPAVVVLGSPRGGTSAVRAAIGCCPDALVLPGEHRAYTTLLARNFPHAPPDSEATNAPLRAEERTFFWEQLAFDLEGEPIAQPTPSDLRLFAWRWALRFRMQWPDHDLPLEQLVRTVCDAHAGLAAAGRAGGARRLGTLALRRLIEQGVSIDPRFYGSGVVQALLKDVALPVHEAPPAPFVEITPWITLEPRAVPRATDRSVLVLKASSDWARLSTMKALLDGRRTTWIHLARNPLASINGLLDGWRHHCFHQHDVRAVSGRAPEIDGVRGPYWKFDLFAGWRAAADRGLEEVCAEQWRQPHQAVLSSCLPTDVVRFEDFQLDPAGFTRSLAGRCGLKPPAALDDRLRAVGPVNATAPPGLGRWRAKRPELIRWVTRAAIADVGRKLGYEPGAAASWS